MTGRREPRRPDDPFHHLAVVASRDRNRDQGLISSDPAADESFSRNSIAYSSPFVVSCLGRSSEGQHAAEYPCGDEPDVLSSIAVVAVCPALVCPLCHDGMDHRESERCMPSYQRGARTASER